MASRAALRLCSCHCLLTSLVLAAGTSVLHFTEVWGGNTDRKTKQNPSQTGITKWAKYLEEPNIRVPRTQGLAFLPYKAPWESLPALLVIRSLDINHWWRAGRVHCQLALWLWSLPPGFLVCAVVSFSVRALRCLCCCFKNMGKLDLLCG